MGEGIAAAVVVVAAARGRLAGPSLESAGRAWVSGTAVERRNRGSCGWVCVVSTVGFFRWVEWFIEVAARLFVGKEGSVPVDLRDVDDAFFSSSLLFFAWRVVGVLWMYSILSRSFVAARATKGKKHGDLLELKIRCYFLFPLHHNNGSVWLNINPPVKKNPLLF